MKISENKAHQVNATLECTELLSMQCHKDQLSKSNNQQSNMSNKIQYNFVHLWISSWNFSKQILVFKTYHLKGKAQDDHDIIWTN